MAGIRQHYLPRFLLNGFGTEIGNRNKRSEYQTWVYKRGHEPFKVNTLKIGVEKRFYGEPGPGSVDEKLTLEETEFSVLLHKLRISFQIDRNQIERLAKLILNLLVRTQHTRKSVLEPSQKGIQGLLDGLLDEKTLAIVLQNHISDDPLQFAKLTAKGSDSTGRKISDQEALASVPYFKELFLSQIETGAFNLDTEVEYLSKFMVHLIPTAIKSAQNSALSRDFSESKSFKRLLSMNWLVKKCDLLILGDVGPIGWRIDENFFFSLLDSTDGPWAVLLPISENAVIFGFEKECRMPKVDQINFASAQLSREFFISKKKIDRNEHYNEHLGAESTLISEKMLKEIISQVLTGRGLKG